MKPKNLERLLIVALSALALFVASDLILDSIDAEQDRAVAACKAPVRRTK